MPNPATPAAVLAAVLDNYYQVEDSNLWPYYLYRQPDAPETCITFYDTTPSLKGKLMTTGRTVTRPGVQVRLRGDTYAVSYRKLDLLKQWMDQVNRLTVRIEEEDFTIQNISQTSGITPLGSTPEKMFEFTLNVLLTLI